MSIWKVILAIVVIVVLVLLIWACYKSCPGSKYKDVEVHEVHVGGIAKDNFNVLFLGDGFAGETELNTYRAAVHHLAMGLLDSAPFCYYKDRINVYRIDVDDPNMEVTEGKCPSGTPKIVPLYDMDLPPEVPPVIGSAGVVEEDLEATHCWTESSATGSPLIVWLNSGGMTKAYALAEVDPSLSISIVVVVTDAYDSYGGGHDEVWPGDVGLVVVSVPQAENTATNKWEVGPNANLLFSHEFAHGMGLLDEYDRGSPPDPEFPPMRNVWDPKPSDFAEPMATSTTDIPWKAALERPSNLGICSQTDLEACYGYLDTSNNTQPCSGVNWSCAYVTRGCQNRTMHCVDFPPCPGTPPDGCPPGMVINEQLEVYVKCDEFAGAWEGGYYFPTKHYRSRRYCRMKDITPGIDFCDGCLIYLNNYLCAFGDKSTCPGWDETKDPC